MMTGLFYLKAIYLGNLAISVTHQKTNRVSMTPGKSAEADVSRSLSRAQTYQSAKSQESDDSYTDSGED